MTWLPALPVESLEDATLDFEALSTQILSGKGNPEGQVAAPVGVLFVREDGGVGSTLYVKEQAAFPTDPTGWAAK